MAEEKKVEAPAAEASTSSASAGAVDTKPLKLFLLINLVVVVAALGVSVFTFIKLSKPEVTDISAEEHGAGGEHGAPPAAEHGAAPAAGGEHGAAPGGGETEKKINLNRFVVNLANSGGNATVSISFQIVFGSDSDVEYAKTYQAKMRDVSISLLSSKSVEEMSSIKGREELKEQMKVAFNSFFGEKAKVSEILFTEFFLNSGA